MIGKPIPSGDIVKSVTNYRTEYVKMGKMRVLSLGDTPLSELATWANTVLPTENIGAEIYTNIVKIGGTSERYFGILYIDGNKSSKYTLGYYANGYPFSGWTAIDLDDIPNDLVNITGSITFFTV